MKKTDAPTMVWPRPQEMRLTGGSLSIAKPLGLAVCGNAEWLLREAACAASSINRAAGRCVVAEHGTGEGLRFVITDMAGLWPNSGLLPVDREEGYVLSISEKGALLAGRDPAGVFRGATTFAQLMSSGNGKALPCAVIRDWPAFPIRGAHVYMPPRKHLPFFYDFLDFMADWKYNTLFLEIGGGMAYDRHPEINRAWAKFCKDAAAYDPKKDRHKESMSTPEMKYQLDLDRSAVRHPTGANALQVSRYFYKDSTHTELAGGKWLTKAEVRGIVEACCERHIEIIPEVQALSHSYYLCMAHPEIAERRDDPWPDTYCPSNPKTYKILFDVMEEVIDMFHPRMIHVGHDEAYTFGVCPKCRKRSGHDILAGDINKIHGFLAARGIRTAMWGDKLMNLPGKKGQRWGAVSGCASRRVCPVTGKVWDMPATYKAANKVSPDLVIMDWYWGMSKSSERDFHKHGFESVIGNWSPLGYKDWETRARVPFVKGAELSTWNEFSPHVFGHDKIYYYFHPGAHMLWHGTSVKLKQPALGRQWARTMTPMVESLTGQDRALVRGKGKFSPVDVSCAASELPAAFKRKIRAPRNISTVLGTGAFRLLAGGDGRLAKAVVIDKAHPKAASVAVGRKADRLAILVGTNMENVYERPSYYSYHRGPASLLKVRVNYSDGKSATFESFYGDDIGPVNGAWPTGGPGYCYRSVPVDLFGKHTLFAQEWKNPRPKAVIESIDMRLGADGTEKGVVLVAAVSAVKEK
jgi:hypothetical protein